MHGADVDVNFAGGDGRGAPSLFQIRVDQRAEVLVGPAAFAPDAIEREVHSAGELEGAPHPVGSGTGLLHLNAFDRTEIVGEDGVKKFRMTHREE